MLAEHKVFPAVQRLMPPNRAAHPDAREASRLFLPSQSRAGGRERYVP